MAAGAVVAVDALVVDALLVDALVVDEVVAVGRSVVEVAGASAGVVEGADDP
ncbi:MAG: hypothetical protein IPP16_13125 [Acidimicrobiaceae bacterium]|nr:hypothetical protein [Acidimicrobiaceae bacterium]MBK9971603.1 hypothetical protein [Acidimicrobiaceae bacterium]